MGLARKSGIKHPAGITVKTPLLVPSFSSKGFRLQNPLKGRRQKYFPRPRIKLSPEKNGTTGWVSDVAGIFTGAAETITESVLVSGYDIFHGHIPLPFKIMTPEITFVDSGGYEVQNGYDYSEVVYSERPTNEWDSLKYQMVLDVWPKHVPAVFVSSDYECRGRPVAKQIEMARELLAKYRSTQLCAFLAKPVSKETTFRSTLREIRNSIDDLSNFDIFAVAEKDLGSSVLLIMENIARVRIALDEAGLTIPIHVFGSLDPLTSCLYFLAGAEIFDGLTWLR